MPVPLEWRLLPLQRWWLPLVVTRWHTLYIWQ